jgi:hypothetical protein
MADTDTIEPLWTAKQVAHFLGVSDDVLYRWRLSGQGPKFLVVTGREKYRYRPSIVREWVAQSEVPSMAALHQAKTRSADIAARQRASLARARQSRWPREAET